MLNKNGLACMEKIISIIFSAYFVTSISFAQLTYQHDVFFEMHSSLLSENNKLTIGNIYKNIPGNATQKINPVGKNEVRGDNNLKELNSSRVYSVIEYLKTIANEKSKIDIDTSYNRYSGEPFYGVIIKKAPIEFEPKYAQLKDLCRKNKRVFTINPNKDETINGIGGTIITFYANSLQCNDGNEVKGNVQISLTEYYSTADILKAQLNTASGPLLLETGGMIYIKANCESCKEKEVKIKDGYSYQISFPTNEIKPGMGIFTGNTDENKNLIDWQVAEFIENDIDLFDTNSEYEDVFVEDMETGEMIKKFKTIEEEKLYHTLNSKDFGWINCDRFIDTPNPSILASTVASPVKNNNVILVFKNIKSIINLYPDANGKYTAQNLPYGEKAVLISYSIANGKTYFGKKEITIGVDNYTELYLIETPFKQFENFLAAL